VAAWCIALAGFAALLLYVFRKGPENQPARVPVLDQPLEDLPPDQPPKSVAVTPQSRLEGIGRRIGAFVEQHGAFPASPPQPQLPVDQRLSWIATLLAAEANAGAPFEADRGWSDPANDRFVRRRIEEFQNPSTPTLVGPAGHPVSHFAGMAGVGADAPELEATHPRAGIFGAGRTTRVEDVKDGLGSTLMVAGVQDGFDSWGASGLATVRALTAEPYFGGPDGLGTGEQGGMTVLMADGSVRFLSADADPLLMRRMAAMADGLPLDAAVPGEPGAATPSPTPVADAPPDPMPAGPDAEPIEVPVAADPPLFDIDAALSQPIAEFNLPTPRPIGDILKLIAELGGVSIDASQLDEAAAARLSEVTALALSDTSVRGILDATVAAAGLQYSLMNGQVVLTSGESPSPLTRE
jgi:hypothetical protein